MCYVPVVGPGGESFDSARTAIARLVLVLLAGLLVLSPPVVAGIAMVDPGALDQTSSWFRGFSPVAFDLDLAKIFLTVGAAVTVFRFEKASRGLTS